MKNSKKIIIKVLTFTLSACLMEVGFLSSYPIAPNDFVCAVEASASDQFLTTAINSVRCSIINGKETGFKMSGRTYYQGIILGDGSYNKSSEISFNVENISSLSMSVGHIDNSGSESAELRIYLDDILDDSLVLSQNNLIETYSIDVSKAKKLKITCKNSEAKFALADISVDKTAPSVTYSTPEYKTTAAFLTSSFDNLRTIKYDGTSLDKSFKMNGRSYYQGVILGNGSYQENSSVSFNVENINRISFSMGHVDNSENKSSEFSVYIDNILEDKFTLTQNEEIKLYELDLSNAHTLRISRNGSYSQYALADIYIDEFGPKNTFASPEYKSSSLLLGSIYDNYRTIVYDGQDTSSFFSMNGRSYYQGIVLGNGSYLENSAFSLNVENLKSISFELGHIDNSENASTDISIYIDNELTDKITLSQNNLIIPYTLDVEKAKNIRIIRNGNYSQYALANIVADEIVPKNTYTMPKYKNSATVLNSIYDNYRTIVYDGVNKAKFFNLNGRHYYQGIILGAGTYLENAAFSLNVENLKTLSFDICHVDNSENSKANMYIYLDGKQVDKFEINQGSLIKHYTIDVSNASTFRVYRDSNYSQYALANFTADEFTPNNTFVIPEYSTAADFIKSKYNDYRANIYESKNFKMNGKEYSTGFTLGTGTYLTSAAASFNVEKLSSVSFTIGHVDDTENINDTLYISKNGIVTQKIALSAEMVPTEITVDVSDASTLRFYRERNYSVYGLGNFSIKAADNSSETEPVTTTTSAQTSVSISNFSLCDINDDGCVNAEDILEIKKLLLSSDPLSDEMIKKADINKDGTVSVLDYTQLINYILDAY